jgi:hypothetical protein
LVSSQGRTAGAPADVGEQAGRCGVRFGCLELAAWIVSDPQGGDLPACEVDLEVILSDALSRIPLDGAGRVEVWRAREAG